MIKMYFIDCDDDMVANGPKLICYKTISFYRGDGYNYNKSKYEKDSKTFENLIIYTNDDAMLEYVDLFNERKYGVDLFIYDFDNKKWIDILKTYPNIHKANNLRKKWLSGLLGGVSNE